MTERPHHPSSDEAPFDRAWQLLEPSEAQRRRMEAGVIAAYEREQESLVQEWLTLFRVRSVLHAGYTLAAAAALVLVTPLGLILLLLALTTP